MMKRILVSNVTRLILGATCALASASCGNELLRTGRSPVYLVINNLLGAQGGGGSTTGVSPFFSDVSVNGTAFNDVGTATIAAVYKDQTPLATSSVLNDVTLTRYRVSYRRSDGRNTPGVDVPWGFDGALSRTISAGGLGGTEVNFDLVRQASKLEPPLRNLVNAGGQILISTIAEVTFYGRDQNGNEVLVVGQIDVTFGDF